MASRLLHRLFHLGSIPAQDRSLLDSEGLILVDEGLLGSVSFRNFRAPGKIWLGRRNWFLGSIALSEKRIVAYAWSRKIIHVPVTDPRLAKLEVGTDGPGRLRIEFESRHFNEQTSGRVTFRLRTPVAEALIERLERVRNP